MSQAFLMPASKSRQMPAARSAAAASLGDSERDAGDGQGDISERGRDGVPDTILEIYFCTRPL